MDKAFYRANKNLPTLVGFASHDFRDLEYEVNYLRQLIKKVLKISKVKYLYLILKMVFNYLWGKVKI